MNEQELPQELQDVIDTITKVSIDQSKKAIHEVMGVYTQAIENLHQLSDLAWHECVSMYGEIPASVAAMSKAIDSMVKLNEEARVALLEANNG